MAQIEVIAVEEILGFEFSDDRKHFIIRLRDTFERELNLAIGSDDLLRKLLIVALEGRSLFPLSKELGTNKTTGLIDTSWIEAGRVTDPGSDDLYLSICRESKGHASFRINRNAAQVLLDVLEAVLRPEKRPSDRQASTKN